MWGMWWMVMDRVWVGMDRVGVWVIVISGVLILE